MQSLSRGLVQKRSLFQGGEGLESVHIGEDSGIQMLPELILPRPKVAAVLEG
jgi:hypothetical protein